MRSSFAPRRLPAIAAAVIGGLLLLLGGTAAVQAQKRPAAWDLTIVHANDVHSRLQEINRFDSGCTDKERTDKQCWGGMARLGYKAQEIVGEVKGRKGNVLLLDAGDQFQGSLFYSTYKGKAELSVMNMLPYDAMAVGNHEFDDGTKPLADFIRGAKFPVLGANISSAADPNLRGKIRNSIVVTRGGRKIGIIGLTTLDTPEIAAPGKHVRFIEPEVAAKPIVEKMRREGVDVIIALSHLGLARDQKLAAAMDGIDVIVGGHSHTLLTNAAANPNMPPIGGPYPIVAKSPGGQNVLIVQAYAYTRFLGRLDVTFDAKGMPVSWKGDTIALTQDVPEDPKIAAEIAKLAGPLDAVRKKVIGSAAVEIVQSNCRKEECLMGNLVADAILDKTKHLGVVAVIQNGGGLRAAIGQGDVTMGQVLTVLPFQNAIATVGLKGSDLVAALENGVSQVETNSGRFPQVAGMRYVWDPAAPAGKRIVAVEMRKADGSYAPLDPNAVYKIAANDFTRRGGDGYAVMRDKGVDPYDFGPGLEDTVAAYIQAKSPVRVAIEGRIKTK